MEQFFGYITNRFIIIYNNNKYYDDIRRYFIKLDKDGKVVYLYSVDYDNNIVLLRGMSLFLPEELINKLDVKTIQTLDISYDFKDDYFENLLDGVKLRKDQILMVKKCLISKSGVAVSATGSGKTIVFAAILKHFYNQLGYYPNTIIIEPTDYLVGDVVKRFESYGIPASAYKESKDDISGIIVSHPMSLLIDVRKTEQLLIDTKVFIIDEYHHIKSDTLQTLSSHIINSEYNLGFSASVIDPGKLPITDMGPLDTDDIKVIGTFGNVLFNLNTDFFIKIGVLATPMLFRISNNADESMDEEDDYGNIISHKENDWHALTRFKIESESRTEKIIRICEIICKYNYNIMILVNTKRHGEDIALKLDTLNLGGKVLLSYGSKVFKNILAGKIKNAYESDEDPMAEFFKGKYKILIGTQHLKEGFDAPSVDAVIIASPGKSDRTVIQGSGRALRKGKSGTTGYSYLFDFTDHKCNVLDYQSRLRFDLYKTQIGVKSKDIYDNYTIDGFKRKFLELEGLE